MSLFVLPPVDLLPSAFTVSLVPLPNFPTNTPSSVSGSPSQDGSLRYLGTFGPDKVRGRSLRPLAMTCAARPIGRFRKVLDQASGPAALGQFDQVGLRSVLPWVHGQGGRIASREMGSAREDLGLLDQAVDPLWFGRISRVPKMGRGFWQGRQSDTSSESLFPSLGGGAAFGLSEPHADDRHPQGWIGTTWGEHRIRGCGLLTVWV